MADESEHQLPSSKHLYQRDDALDLLFLRQVGRVDQHGVLCLHRLGGVAGIAYTEIMAYAQLHEFPIDPFEVAAIKAMDHAYLMRARSA